MFGFGWRGRSRLKTIKISRRVGEDEVLDLTLNAETLDEMLDTTRVVLDFLQERVEDRNTKVLAVAEAIAAQQQKPGPRRA